METSGILSWHYFSEEENDFMKVRNWRVRVGSGRVLLSWGNISICWRLRISLAKTWRQVRSFAVTHIELSKLYLLPLCLSFLFLCLFFCVCLPLLFFPLFPFLFLYIPDADAACIPIDMDDLFLIKQTFHLGQIFPYTKLNLPFVASPVVPVLLSRTTQSMTNSSALNPSKAWILWSCFPLICSSPSQQLPPAPWLFPTPKFLGLSSSWLPLLDTHQYLCILLTLWDPTQINTLALDWVTQNRKDPSPPLCYLPCLSWWNQ